jgi:AcrR family transcriptional regulator
VADAVGLHRSSVYRYFNSKEELVTAVVVQATLRVGREVIAQLGESAPPERFLVEGVAIALAAMANDPVHQSLMAPSASEAMARVGGKALTEGLRPLVEPMFSAAAEQGLLRRASPPTTRGGCRSWPGPSASSIWCPTPTTSRRVFAHAGAGALRPGAWPCP